MEELWADSIRKSYGNRQILTDIFLRIAEPGVIALFGRNGSGKTTLLEILFGSTPADNRYVRISGETVSGISQSSRKIAYLTQNSCIPSFLRVRQAARLMISNEQRQMLEEDPWYPSIRSRRFGSLSHGERRYAELVLTLLKPASIFMLDEPFSGLSPLLCERIKQRIAGIAQTKSVLIADHAFRYLEDIAKRCLLLHDGGLTEVAGFDELRRLGYLPDID